MTIPLDRELKSLRAHLAARRFADAENACRAILNSHPDDADALHLFGIVALSTERYDEAIERLRAAIQRRPDSPEFQNTLGEAFRRSGRIHDAVTSYQAALALRPQYVPALNNLALALLSQGDFAGAAQAAQCAAEHQPANARAFYLLGTALEKLGQLEEAIRALARAVHIRPNYPAALKQLGELLRRFPISSDCVQELLPYDRNDPQGIEQFGRLMVALERPEDAEEAFRQTLCRRPNDAAVALDLALALDRQGRAPEAIEQYQRAHALTGDDVFRVVAATRMPIIYQSNDEIRQWRQRLHDQIDGLRRARLRIDLERKTVPPLFFSAYQGFNDCDLLRDYARLLQPPPPIELPRRHRGSEGRVRVGFISAYFREHSVAQFTKGLIAQLVRDKFEVIVLSVGQYDDVDARFIREHADAQVEIPLDLPEARRIIAAQALDILMYTDVGMDDLTYTLAFSRLAPRQCTTWGHPVSSGVPAIDDYISSELLESDDAQAHYTERLVRLKNLPIYYYRPAPLTTRKALRDFGFGDDLHVYGCLQNLFKMHPDFDPILNEILQRDPRGVIVLPQGKVRHWDRVLRARLQRTLGRNADRVIFLPRMSYNDYLALTAACPVLLAPIHFGAGITSYEAFALGTPTVTMPSPYLKGRITYGMYRAMNVMDCVASSPQQYADIAVRLATDSDWRRHVSDKILAAGDVIYDNPAGVRDLEQYFLSITS